jgi:hypothetical protein
VSPPPGEAEREQARREIARWLFSALVAAGSIVRQRVRCRRGPNWIYGMPGMFYALLGFTGPVVDRFAPQARRPAA